MSCCRGLPRTSPSEHHAGCHSENSFCNFLIPKLFPEIWCARLAPSSPAASLGAENSKIQRLDLEKSPENHSRATDSNEVGPMKRIPSANYSLSIALQENALRVMCLTRGTPRSAPGEPELLQRPPAHQPW